MNGRVPHLRVVVTVSAFVLLGFAGVSVFVLGWTDDKVTTGNIIGTWVNFAMLAVGFWLGSSSGGKASPAEPPKVEIEQPAGKPVPTVTTLPSPAFGVDDPEGGA